MVSALATGMGSQTPRIGWVPRYDHSIGDDAIALADRAGISLDPWQQTVLRSSLGQRSTGQWTAPEVGLCVARQNGKTELLIARMLTGLFLLREPLIIYSANLFDSASEILLRLENVIEGCNELYHQVELSRGNVAKHGNNDKSITLKTGERIKFKARTSGGGRGFTADCLMLDEAMYIKESMIGSTLPTLSAVPNPQVWYVGSSVNQATMEDGLVFARVRQRGIDRDPTLAYFEWSVPEDDYRDNPAAVVKDPHYWAMANPALGLRLTHDTVDREARSMPAEQFATERLGVGDWPRTDGFARRPIQPEDWQACLDATSTMAGPVALAFDVAPDRSYTALAAAGKRSDGLDVVDLIQHSRGTGWVVGRLTELVARHRVIAVVCDAAGPAASLLPDLLQLRCPVIAVTARDNAKACGSFYDAIQAQTIRHGNQSALNMAVDGCAIRPLADAWSWHRRDSATDISPLVAATLALWGLHTQQPEEGGVWDLNQWVHDWEEAHKAPEVEGIGPSNNRVVPLTQALSL